MPAIRLLLLGDGAASATLRDAASGDEFELATATAAADFLDRLERWKPALVVLDIRTLAASSAHLLTTLKGRLGGIRIFVTGADQRPVADVARLLSEGLKLDVAGTLLTAMRPDEIHRLLEGSVQWCTEQTLSAAIAKRELFLLYQPKIGLRDERVVGYEGLLRWRHVDRGIVTPDSFLPMAERTGLIGRVTEAVIECGLEDAAAWGGTAANSLAINLSGFDLQDSAFADRLAAQCSRQRVNPDRLVLELTEASAMADRPEAINVMTRLRLKGFKLSIDDFGTGHSSLLQLARLPFSELKIDKTFVIEANTSPEARVIIKSTVDLAHNLGLRAVAEGVEDGETKHLVRELGCDIAQGFGIGRPMPATQISAWLADQSGSGSRTTAIAASDGTRLQAPLPPGTKPFDGSESMRNLLTQAIAHRLNPLWGLGRNALVGWQPSEDGIEALMMPYQTILDRFSASKRLLHGRRLMGTGTFRQAIELSGVQPVSISLPFRIADDDQRAVPTHVVEQALRRYTITETPHRAVALFAIERSSRSAERANGGASLDRSIATALELMRALGKPIELSRTTFDDNFCIWNRKQGAEADLDTYLLTLLIVADNAIALREAAAGTVPRLRTCFSVGPHYSYAEAQALDSHGHEPILGDVTTELVRMVKKCLPGQILVGDFSRPTEADSEPANPLELVLHAEGAFAKYNDLRLHGHTVAGVRCYLTGEARNAGQFDVTRFRLRDPHDGDHHVFNQKFNVYLTESPRASARVEPLYLGKQRTELGAFQALEAERVEPPRSIAPVLSAPES
jgi:EAL domain-containing protein (putative c-di-GMP-specific phosphodiesterase class I)